MNFVFLYDELSIQYSITDISKTCTYLVCFFKIYEWRTYKLNASFAWEVYFPKEFLEIKKFSVFKIKNNYFLHL